MLSANDTGETGGHQAGMLIPRDRRLLDFFPPLDIRQLNPRCHLMFEDTAGTRWELAFIYYNNRIFGGTRDEYRLTRMTRFIRENSLSPGDEVILGHSSDDRWSITVRRASAPELKSNAGFVLKLGSGWKVVSL